MNIIKDKILADLTTFRIGGKAKFFCSVESKEDLKKAVNFAKEKNLPIFVLGGGSNILVSDKGFDGLVLKIEIKGIKVPSSKSLVPSQDAHDSGLGRSAPRASGSMRTRDFRLEDVFIRVGAGENWDDFVTYAVERGYGGLENLSLIPGTVGAALVQNIGAYGVEVGNLVEEVEVFDLTKNLFKTFSQKECKFSYRDSIFKEEKGRYVITSVLFKLEKNSKPDISYKDLREYFSSAVQTNSERLVPNIFDRSRGTQAEIQSETLDPESNSLNFRPSSSKLSDVRLDGLVPRESNDFRPTSLGYELRRTRGNDKKSHYPSISEVRNAIIAIRTAKLPDIKKVGTAGSFFKNPILSKEKYLELKDKYQELPGFPESDNSTGGRVKISLAWIIDKICGLKGKNFGKAGIHETQALVIVNYGIATFDDVEKVAREVEKMVKEKTGIEIEREVVMV